ncbi:MAG: CD1845 family protein [Oscillospiraceae bacterium]|nr:CD1845 family protein [Oscillospiraceae bacterium]
MRFLLKILFAPIIAALAVVTWFFAFLLSLSSVAFGIAGGILGFFGVVILFADSVKNGIIMLVLAFLVSPYGLPMLAAWLLGQLQKLRYAVQDKIYG